MPTTAGEGLIMNDFPLPLQKGVVYGPVKSRRLGHSLGLNLSPSEIKLCSLNCSYCQYSWTGMLVREAESFRRILPTAKQIRESLGPALEKVAAGNTPLDHITFSGNGEPTLHPDFPEIVDIVIELRNSFCSGIRIACLSNSATAGNPKVLAALLKIDEPVMKLDTGSEVIFKRLNRPAQEISFAGIIESLERFKGRLAIQSLFVRGSVDNTTEEALGSYFAALSRIRPGQVQIYTLDRAPADKKLIAVSNELLTEIKTRIEREVNLPVVVY
jgi:wyosine [tRNA(Phe)-imidazoG37] synthetase (radical SAM superfamily)